MHNLLMLVSNLHAAVDFTVVSATASVYCGFISCERSPMTHDKLALAIVIFGILFAVVIAIIGNYLGRNWMVIAFYAFAGLQVVALATGATTWRSPFGKAAVIASICLLSASVLFI